MKSALLYEHNVYRVPLSFKNDLAGLSLRHFFFCFLLHNRPDATRALKRFH